MSQNDVRIVICVQFYVKNNIRFNFNNPKISLTRPQTLKNS